MALSFRSVYHTSILVDDPDTGEVSELPINVARLGVEAMAVFMRDYQRMSDPPSNRLIFVRKPEGEEQERNANGEPVVPLSVIATRRLAEMTDEQRAKYDKLDAEDEAFARAFLIRAVCEYITVPEGALEFDGVPVLDGKGLLRVFGGRRDVLQQLLVAIYAENSMSAAEKKVQRSLYDLKRSLNRQLLEVAGPKREATADAAASAASVPNEDAANQAATLSGLEVLPNH